MQEVSGPFEVKITPEESKDSMMGRMSLDKTYSGALTAAGVGTMLTGVTDVKGSAGYVAIEKISGELNGLKGSFMIQHSGIQQGDTSRLNIEIIPDSGTEELAGIEGTMKIAIGDDGHSYALKFQLSK